LKILQKIFYGLALLFIPLAIILDNIGGVPQPLRERMAGIVFGDLSWNWTSSAVSAGLPKPPGP
jgi:hypothetical protein